MEQGTLGKRIAYHRKRLGMTQEQLAQRVGVSAQAVSKWENNLSCPDITILPELASIFGISVDELLGRTPPKEERVHEAEVIKPEEKEHILDYTIGSASRGTGAPIGMELFHWTDTYVIDVHDPADALHALMVVLAIDAEKCSRSN